MNALTHLLFPKMLCNIPILRNSRLLPGTVLPLINSHPFNTINDANSAIPGFRKMSSTNISSGSAEASRLRPFIFRQVSTQKVPFFDNLEFDKSTEYHSKYANIWGIWNTSTILAIMY